MLTKTLRSEAAPNLGRKINTRFRTIFVITQQMPSLIKKFTFIIRTALELWGSISKCFHKKFWLPGK